MPNEFYQNSRIGWEYFEWRLCIIVKAILLVSPPDKPLIETPTRLRTASKRAHLCSQCS